MSVTKRARVIDANVYPRQETSCRGPGSVQLVTDSISAFISQNAEDIKLICHNPNPSIKFTVRPRGFGCITFSRHETGREKKIYLSCTAARNKWRSRRSNGHSSSSMVLEEMKKRRNMARVCHGYVNNLETNGKITFHSVQQSHLRKNCRYNWVMNTIFFWILVRRSSVIDFDVSKSAETWLIFFSILNLMYNPLMLGNQEKLWKVMKKF